MQQEVEDDVEDDFGVWEKSLKNHIFETPNGDIKFDVYSKYTNYGDAYASHLKIQMTGLGGTSHVFEIYRMDEQKLKELGKFLIESAELLKKHKSSIQNRQK